MHTDSSSTNIFLKKVTFFLCITRETANCFQIKHIFIYIISEGGRLRCVSGFQNAAGLSDQCCYKENEGKRNRAVTAH